MNDHLNENNIPGDDLSPDELRLLKEALDAAWPSPEKSIRGGVMEAVKRERAAMKRREIRRCILKYGSFAACLLLVTVAGIRILPAMTSKSADMAAADTYAYTAVSDMPTETLPETAVQNDSDAEDGAENGEELKKNMLFSTMSTAAAQESVPVPEEEMPETEAEFLADAAPETIPETEAPQPADKLMFTAAPRETAEECAVVECEEVTEYADDAVCAHSGVFADSYHNIPDLLIACTGEDIYLAWLEGTEGCAQNIAGYLNYMEANSTALLSDIEMIYDATDLWYQFDWNFDLFESGDAAAIEEYYRNGGDFTEMVKRESEYRFKLALLDETGAEKTVDVCAWSIADLVEEEAMTLSVLTAVYEASADQVRTDYPGYEAQQYDLAALHDYAYSAENDEPTPPGSIAPGRHEDEMFRVDAVK